MTSGKALATTQIQRAGRGLYSPDFNSNDLPEMGIGVDKDPLDEIVTELIGADLLVLADVRIATAGVTYCQSMACGDWLLRSAM